MTIGRICERSVDLAGADESAHDAAQRMQARNVGTLVVLDEHEQPVGILTDRDLALRVVGAGLDAHTTSVRDVMTPHPVTVSVDTPIETALSRMRAKGIRRLLVVDERQRLAGMVSVDDILLLLAEEFGELGRLLDRSSPHDLART